MNSNPQESFIDIQLACTRPLTIASSDLTKWGELVLNQLKPGAELTLRLVDLEEMIYLNTTYRHKEGPTNVLAFPSDLPPEIQEEVAHIGDVIISPDVMAEEIIALDKKEEQHWAHIVIHGILHLLGYDHIKTADEEIMQAKEIELLALCGFESPYDNEENL